MGVEDQYSLNWGNHTHHIKKSFDTLLRDNDFVDVTISCQGKKLKAHRMILSACSTYFHDVLRDNPCSHPIIILRDIEYENIAGILQFMYKGEVQVPMVNFSSFLKTAELLEVSGLVSPESSNNSISETNVSKDKNEIKDVKEAKEDKQDDVVEEFERSKPAPASKKLERKKLLEARKRSSEIVAAEVEQQKKRPEPKKRPSEAEEPQQKKKKEKAEVDESVKCSEVTATKSTEEPADDEPIDVVNDPITAQKLANYQDLLSDDSYLTKEANPECECPVCAQKFASIYHLKQHIPFHMGDTKCKICGNVFSRMDLLRRHQQSVHKK